MNAIYALSVGAMATVLTPNLDGDHAPPFKNKVTSFQVLIGGTAELNVHLLHEIKNKPAVTTKSQHFYTLLTQIAEFFLSLSFPTFPLLSMADAVWTVSPCRP